MAPPTAEGFIGKHTGLWASTTLRCAHCGNEVPAFRAPATATAQAFCCAGCETVFAFLAGREAAGAPAAAGESFAYLDDAEFRRLYGAGANRMEFYLEGVHCAACVWLVDKLPGLVPGVNGAALDLSRSVAQVEIAPGGSFAAAAAQFSKFGFRAHVVKDGDVAALMKQENRKLLTRLGVAAASLMNLMLFAIALYSGAAGEWVPVFAWASLVFFLPILFYSAVPFYAATLASLRAGKISIDVPIVFGILVGAVMGVVNLFRPAHLEHIYFDSLGALVFLLLSARYLVRRAQQKALGATQLVFRLMPASCRRWNGASGTFETAPVELVRAGDRIEVRPGDVVPADGRVLRGASELNLAVLTGESRPEPVRAGDAVYAGTVNGGGTLEVLVESSGAATRMGQIVKLVQEASGRKTPIANAADRVAGRFTAGVLLVGAATFAFWAWRAGLSAAATNTMALFIVTCPCALALSAPLANLVSMSRAARLGVLIKGPDVFERIAAAKDIFLDKTGTLTEGRFGVAEVKIVDPTVDEASLGAAVFAIEQSSPHPVAAALLAHFAPAQGTGPAGAGASAVKEMFGRGVSGVVAGRRYEIYGIDAPAGAASVDTHVAVDRDGVRAAVIRLGDRLRADAPAAVAGLRKHGLAVHLISGDGEGAVRAAAAQAGIDPANVRAGAGPEDKLAAVRAAQGAIMVGDGANDSAALAAAGVGIAVHGGMEVSLRAADVYFTHPGTAGLAHLVRGARETVNVIFRNFKFSFVYNLVGGTLAITGLMSPLVAAVLMPFSSLTILASSLWGAKAYRP